MAGVQSIERAFVLLRALVAAPAGVSELAERVDLPKSTVARLLAALEAEEAVDRDPDTMTYRVGSGLADLAGETDPTRSLIATARPYLVGLSIATGESAGFDVLDGRMVHFIDQVEADHDVQVRDWTGESGPAHSLPAGIVLLADSGCSANDYVAEGIEAQTSNTITNAADLEARLTQVRSAGYAWGFEEFAIGINSVAAPVRGPAGTVGALRVHGPSFRFPDPNRTHDIGMDVADAARRLSEQLHAMDPR